MINQWMPRNASTRLLSRPSACSRGNQTDCARGINCLDVRPEEVAIAALELLTQQTYNQSDYKGIFDYKMEAERADQASAR